MPVEVVAWLRMRVEAVLLRRTAEAAVPLRRTAEVHRPVEGAGALLRRAVGGVQLLAVEAAPLRAVAEVLPPRTTAVSAALTRRPPEQEAARIQRWAAEADRWEPGVVGIREACRMDPESESSVPRECPRPARCTRPPVEGVASQTEGVSGTHQEGVVEPERSFPSGHPRPESVQLHRTIRPEQRVVVAPSRRAAAEVAAAPGVALALRGCLTPPLRTADHRAPCRRGHHPDRRR